MNQVKRPWKRKSHAVLVGHLMTHQVAIEVRMADTKEEAVKAKLQEAYDILDVAIKKIGEADLALG